MNSDMELSLQQITINRRHCIALAAGLVCGGIFSSAMASQIGQASNKPLTVLVLGDSLSAEYGLKRGTGWVALLEKQLLAAKTGAAVVNASISGDTSSGGRSRLPALLKLHHPDIVVIELGGNDALRGMPLTLTEDNLNAMAHAAKGSGAKVLLLGMQVPPNYGKDYANRFAALFGSVAKTNGAGWVPFFLKGIADVPDSASWFQADRLHPKEEAHPILLANVWPQLEKWLK
jgi:acyl-CoA thioesterase-1